VMFVGVARLGGEQVGRAPLELSDRIHEREFLEFLKFRSSSVPELAETGELRNSGTRS
jgi:hypothetical protein